MTQLQLDNRDLSLVTDGTRKFIVSGDLAHVIGDTTKIRSIGTAELIGLSVKGGGGNISDSPRTNLVALYWKD